MSKIIFEYIRCPVWRGGYSFSIFDNGVVCREEFIYKGSFSKRQVIDSKKITIPQSVVENVKNFLNEQKKFIDKLPKEIQCGFLIDGVMDCFSFMEKTIRCWNPERISDERYRELESFFGKFSDDVMIQIHQQNYILDVFEKLYNFLKTYGLEVFSWNYFYCDWEIEKMWNPQNYSPDFSVEDWKKLLQDKEIFSSNDLEIMKRFLDFGENGIFKATYSQLAYTYGENYDFYKKNIDELGKKIFSKTNCRVLGNNFKNILLEESKAGSFARKFDTNDKKIYKLRDKLADALLETDLSEIKLYSDEKISRQIDFSSKLKFDDKKNKNVENNLNRVVLEKLRFAVLDSSRKIPIKSWLDETDYRGYYILLNKKDSRLKNILEKMGYVNRDPRLTDDVATKLLAKDLAYKISRKDFEEIEAQFEKGTGKFSPITSEEYENLKIRQIRKRQNML